MGTFREFLLNEKAAAGVATGRSAGLGRATFLRGGMPWARTELPPPIPYGKRADAYWQERRDWAYGVFSHIVHLQEAKRTTIIKGQEYLPEYELKEYHPEALDLLKRSGVLSANPERLNVIEVSIEAVQNLFHTSPPNVQAVLQHIYTAYSNRSMLTRQKDWMSFEGTYYLPIDLLGTLDPAMRTYLQDQGVLGGEDVIGVYKLNVRVAQTAINRRQFIDRFILSHLQQAMDGAMQKTTTFNAYDQNRMS